MATEIGEIKTVIGNVVATAADGSQRNLQVGDKLFADEIITTGATAAVEIEFIDGNVMDLGRSSQAVLDSEMFDPQQVIQTQTEVQDEVAALQQALLDGTDPTQVGEATAAGANADLQNGNEGTNAVTVDYLAPEVPVTSGFETTGPSVAFLSGVEDQGVPEQGVQDAVPVAIDDGALVFTGGEFSIGDAEDTLFDDVNNNNVFSEQSLAGNLLSNDSFGADGPGGLVSVSYTGETAGVVGSLVGGIATFSSPYWTLTVNPDGSYEFTQTGAYAHAEGTNVVQESFSYTINDADGDTASAVLRINIVDDVPEIDSHTESVAAYEFTVTNHDEVSSAGFHNSYGYYLKGDGGVPTTGVVIWDDVHDKDTVPVTITLPNGLTPDDVGFFIIPNGDNRNSSLTDDTEVTFKFVDGSGAEVPVDTSGGQWQAFAGDTALKGNGSHVLFDAAELNKDGQDHVDDNYLIGNQNWEDLQIPNGDGDFNDVNVNVDWTQVQVTGDVADISFGADGPGSVEYSDISITSNNNLLTSDGQAIVFSATDTDSDGFKEIVGKVGTETVLTIDGLFEGSDSIDIQFSEENKIDQQEGQEPLIVDISTTATVTDSDFDSVSAQLNFNLNIGDYLASSDDV